MVMRVFGDVVRLGRRVVAVAQLVMDVWIVMDKLARQRTDHHADGAGDQAGKLGRNERVVVCDQHG
jgi:hypothetical protein